MKYTGNRCCLRMSFSLKDLASINLFYQYRGNKRRKLAEPKRETHPAHGRKSMKKDTAQGDQPNESHTEITSEALTILIGDIQETSRLVDQKIRIYQDELRKENDDLNPHFISPGQSNGDQQSLEDKYMQEMKTYQFGEIDFFSIINIVFYEKVVSRMFYAKLNPKARQQLLHMVPLIEGQDTTSWSSLNKWHLQ